MKKKILLLLCLLFIFCPLIVNAASIFLDCPSTTKRGDDVACNIRLSSSDTVTGVQANVSVSDGFTYKNYTIGNNLSGTSSNNIFLVYGNGTSGNEILLGTYVYKTDNTASGVLTVRLSDIMVTDSDAELINSNSTASDTVKVLSDVNTLSNLIVEGGTLEFNENTTTYNMTIDNANTNIVATKKDSASTVSGVGNKSLKYGINTFKITVTSESGIKKDYTLNITRPDNRSTVNTLSSLKLSEGNIKFSTNTTSYKVTVEYDVSSVKVEAEVTDEKSSFVSGYGPRDFNLKVGNNDIEIKVKAENESVKIYKIAVTRKPDPNDVRSDNNYLSELNLSEGIITFDKNEFEYRVTILNEVEKIEVTAKTEDTKAKYKINAPETLEVGENEITIVVTAENGSTREYKIIVDRKAENEVISSNNKLSSLDVDGYQLNFNSEIYEYTLKIADEKSLIFSYQQEDENSDVTINGNENLKNGSIITVNVISEDGNTQVYKINIQKEEKDNLLMYIVIGVGVLLLLIIIIVIIANSKKKKNSDYERDNTISSINSNEDLAINANVMPQNMNMTYMQNQQPNVQNMQPNFTSQPVQNQNMQSNILNQNMQESVQNNNGQNNNFF